MSEQLIEPRVRYEEQIKALPCVSKRTKIYSLSGTVRSGNVARILLDNYQNGILETKDCYLNFTCNPVFTGAGIAGAVVSTEPAVTARNPEIPSQQVPIYRNYNTAATLVQKVEVLVNGVSICVMDNYNMIAQALAIAGQDPTNSGFRGVTEGGDGGLTVLEAPPIAASTATVTPAAPFNNTKNIGTDFRDIASLQGENFAYVVGCNVGEAAEYNKLTGKPQTYSLPLHSILGSCFKNIPLGYLQNSGLEIQITFEQDGLKSFHTLNPAYPLESVECTFSDIAFDNRINYYEPASMDVINDLNGWKPGGEPITWVGEQFKVSTGQVTVTQQNSTSEFTTLVPNSRYRCLDYLLYTSFPSTQKKIGTNVIGGINPWLPFIGVNSLQYRIGATLHPRSQINTLSNAVECTKCCLSACSQSLTNTMMCRHGTYLNERQDNLGETGTSARTSDAKNVQGFNRLFPRGVIGVSTGTFNDDHGCISGTDTSNLTVQCLTSIKPSVAGENYVSKTAIAPQTTAWISKISVAYQLDPNTGRMGVSF